MQPSAPPEAMTTHVSIDFSVSDRIEVGRPGRVILRLAPVGVIGRPVGAAVQVDSTTNENTILIRLDAERHSGASTYTGHVVYDARVQRCLAAGIGMVGPPSLRVVRPGRPNSGDGKR